eukprot:TRINITY_DN11161_c0_g1_i1.p2 TRINITY_DN11161_c0_g1~~TRINITY_DN11161_c0_g1_i1.p2  ORF type:complete len:141 (+),score=16.19 TRINITY_DN11161_c0_g1_i1:100-522(+)
MDVVELLVEECLRRDIHPRIGTNPRGHARFLLVLNGLIQRGTVVRSCEVSNPGEQTQEGFCFITKDAKNLLSELYLDCLRPDTTENNNLLRAANTCLQKYFHKVGPFTYTYKDVPLYVAGETEKDMCSRISELVRRYSSR